MDRLEKMFMLQQEYQKLSGNGDFPRVSGTHVSTFALGLISELGEVLQEYKGWKPWTNSDNYTHNKYACKEEVADMWHFMINLTLSLGISYDELVEAFDGKHDKILKRIK